MQGELQRIVDALAAHAGRPALIEDRRQRVVVYSEHTGVMDDVRKASILRRQTTPEVMAWFRDVGIMEAREPVRTPASAELDLLPRVCVPIRHQDLLLGFVWFIDPDGTMADTDLEATGLVSELSLALYRENLLGELASQRETEVARTLLADSAATRDRSVRALREAGLIAGDGPATALVAQLVTSGQPPDEVARLALEQALVTTRRWIGTREALHVVRDDHGVLLLCGGRFAGRPSPEAAAKLLDDNLRQATRGLSAVERTVVGIGQARAGLADAVGSYGEALRSARVGVRLPALGRVVSWSGLGIYRVLSRLDGQQPDISDVHPGLERLLREQSNPVLLETLERYLDLAGNAHATAEQLRLHRTTLYYRLQRIEELAETDLKDGNERLCLHLALKLGRLTGRYRPEG
ncbi:DNA-binding transcriptional regulator, PucR family [Micromonospora echinaurantiaca]|uniref:DNA-binding transcriptional regulator, PucR family n=1 Tax=Micromonospora echinaurantiaca TaxID=47857 RepID=A0A1C5IA87_9ACTN|nr:PucR family transcriptional regulator [Micromonospora echinaurantiaca]SCG55187.1 DNA-binding transcriptional regulator, PucR family [Micromonospora echinaurantiaca]